MTNQSPEEIEVLIRKHGRELWDLFPETWTDYNNLNVLRLGYHFKLYELDWRTDPEFGNIMVALIRAGVIDIQEGGRLIRRSHRFGQLLAEIKSLRPEQEEQK